jgi:hypothetical protein
LGSSYIVSGELLLELLIPAHLQRRVAAASAGLEKYTLIVCAMLAVPNLESMTFQGQFGLLLLLCRSLKGGFLIVQKAIEVLGAGFTNKFKVAYLSDWWKLYLLGCLGPRPGRKRCWSPFLLGLPHISWRWQH